jgi:Lrp/AsnC family transcriptional regulator, leucine-responsive regulatory protein
VSGETGPSSGAQAFHWAGALDARGPEQVGGARLVHPRSGEGGGQRGAPRRSCAAGPENLPGGARLKPLRFAFVEDVDRAIVRLLSEDGRRSFTDLSRETGLSVSAVHQRVRRLEQRGVIRGYRTVADPVALGLPLTAFVSIKPIDPSADDDAPDRLAHLTAIEACHSVAGEESYILKVRVATPADLELLLQQIRAAANVSTRTTVVLSTPYEDRPLSL